MIKAGQHKSGEEILQELSKALDGTNEQSRAYKNTDSNRCSSQMR